MLPTSVEARLAEHLEQVHITVFNVGSVDAQDLPRCQSVVRTSDGVTESRLAASLCT